MAPTQTTSIGTPVPSEKNRCFFSDINHLGLDHAKRKGTSKETANWGLHMRDMPQAGKKFAALAAQHAPLPAAGHSPSSILDP